MLQFIYLGVGVLVVTLVIKHKKELWNSCEFNQFMVLITTAWVKESKKWIAFKYYEVLILKQTKNTEVIDVHLGRDTQDQATAVFIVETFRSLDMLIWTLPSHVGCLTNL